MSKPSANPPSRQTGFTLLEMVGVMVVLSVLAAAIVPNLIGTVRVQRQIRDREDLRNVAAALKRGVEDARAIPSVETDYAAGSESRPAHWVELAMRGGGGGFGGVAASRAGLARRAYLFAPDWAGLPFGSVVNNGSGWPDGDESGGWLPPGKKGLRVILLSTTDRRLLLQFPDPRTLTREQFEWMWNELDLRDAKTDLTRAGFSKAEGVASLAIERVDLRDLAVPVVLEARRRLQAPFHRELTLDNQPSPTLQFVSMVEGVEGASFATSWEVRPKGVDAGGVARYDYTITVDMVFRGRLDRAVSEGEKTPRLRIGPNAAQAPIDLGVDPVRPGYALDAAVHGIDVEAQELVLLKGQLLELLEHPGDATDPAGPAAQRQEIVAKAAMRFLFDGTRWSD